MNIQSIKQRYGIIGSSEQLDRGLDTAVRVSATDLTVLIRGASGVGKDVFSRIIHDMSKRKHNNFISINCGAIPEGTINSELFGHEKGSFTGASSDRKGYFETVNGGTIFLDEIGEMPLDTQAYLLRVLESGEYLRVGSSKVQKTDVRVIAATNVNLEEKIKKGKFREDLYYRLNTVPIKIPSLSERREDIYKLFRKFSVDIAEKYRMDPVQLDEAAKSLIINYSWPGNIRELKNLVEQISILSDNKMLTAEALLKYSPNLAKRNLPSIKNQEETESLKEREILFKFLFEMKADLNDLKSLVFEMIKRNQLEVPQIGALKNIFDGESSTAAQFEKEARNYPIQASYEDEDRPVILSSEEQEEYDESEIVEENLSLDEKIKELIIKALEKHRGRRRDAAADLGISERTLYRKIKEYEISE
jgi:DNA-binding NtrC family response regulator